jgi:hypothetical protein
MRKIILFLCFILLFSGVVTDAHASLIEYTLTGQLELISSGPDAYGLDGANFALSSVVDTDSSPTLNNGPPSWPFDVTVYDASAKVELSGTTGGTKDGLYEDNNSWVQLDRAFADDRMYIKAAFNGLVGAETNFYTFIDFDPGFLGDRPFAPPELLTNEIVKEITGSVSIIAAGSGEGFDYYDYLNVTASARPVPEPATMLLLGSGLVGLVGFRRKFKK